jgi:hypothetical protein
VTLYSPTGPVEVRGVTRDGAAWSLPDANATTIPPGGVEWTLDPGDYVVETDGGVAVPLRVPRDRSVLIPGPGADYAAELLEALGIDEPAEPERP